MLFVLRWIAELFKYIGAKRGHRLRPREVGQVRNAVAVIFHAFFVIDNKMIFGISKKPRARQHTQFRVFTKLVKCLVLVYLVGVGLKIILMDLYAVNFAVTPTGLRSPGSAPLSVSAGPRGNTAAERPWLPRPSVSWR